MNPRHYLESRAEELLAMGFDAYVRRGLGAAPPPRKTPLRERDALEGARQLAHSRGRSSQNPLRGLSAEAWTALLALMHFQVTEVVSHEVLGVPLHRLTAQHRVLEKRIVLHASPSGAVPKAKSIASLRAKPAKARARRAVRRAR